MFLKYLFYNLYDTCKQIYFKYNYLTFRIRNQIYVVQLFLLLSINWAHKYGACLVIFCFLFGTVHKFGISLCLFCVLEWLYKGSWSSDFERCLKIMAQSLLHQVGPGELLVLAGVYTYLLFKFLPSLIAFSILIASVGALY